MQGEGNALKFLSVCPELGTPTWGQPQFSNITQDWFIAWYRSNGMKTALTRPTAKEQKWIDANKKKIEASQKKIDSWLAALWTTPTKKN